MEATAQSKAQTRKEQDVFEEWTALSLAVLRVHIGKL
jgi:hypothetical protein